MRRALDVASEPFDCVFDGGIAAREGCGAAMILDCLLQIASALMRVRNRPERGEIVGRTAQDRLELGLRLVEPRQSNERPPERDSRGEVAWVTDETCAAAPLGRFEIAGASVLFGKLRKGNRRRIGIDPRAKFGDSGIVGQKKYGIRLKVQGFKSSKVQRFEGSKVRRFKSSRVQRFESSRVQKFEGSKFEGSREV